MTLQKSKTRFNLASAIGTILAITLLFSCIGTLAQSRADSGYNNVQVFLTPESQIGGTLTYTLSVYNSSGYLVSSSQSEYPAFSLELPSSSYLFTASIANSSTLYYDYYTTSQYGYQLVQVSSSTTVSITTMPMQDISLTQIKIHAQFVNGTAMSGASIYGSVVGLYYWWPSASPYSSISMSNQTDSNGDAYITVPSLPITVSAWNWVQVNLPTNDTTVQREIGGQLINVTVYWQPTYVGLSGSALIIPPSTSASITLYANEQPNYWYSPLPVAYAQAEVSGTSATVASGPSAVPAAVYGQQQTQSELGKGIAPVGSSPTENSASPPSQIPPINVGAISSSRASSQMEYATIAASIAAVFSAGMIGLFVFKQRSGKNAIVPRSKE